MKSLLLQVFLILCLTIASPSQQRYPSDDPVEELRGFTRSFSEHMISYIDKPFCVRVVRGEIVVKNTPDALVGAIVQIRGPAEARRISATKTDRRGHFRITRVPQGKYAFKATLLGFQSVVGTIIVSNQAPKDSAIRIGMPAGV